MKQTPGIWSLIIFISCFIGFLTIGNADELNEPTNASDLNVLLLDFGPIGDHGWTYEGHVAATKIAKKLDFINLSEYESAGSGNAANVMRDYAGDGCDLIFCHSGSFKDAIQEVAPEYPNIIFMWCGGTGKLNTNVGTYYLKIYEGEYLLGIVAGCSTKTNKIAFVAPILDAEVIKAIDAFAKGVSLVNPDAKVYVEWVGSWYDPKREKQLAMDLIANGCDVITHGTDSDATGEAAEETGTYFISLGSNTARFFPHVYLTGIVWNWEPVMTDIVESVHNGTWASRPEQNWLYGFAEGGMELAPFSDLVSSDVIALVKEKQNAITSGELDVFEGISDSDLQKIHYLEPNVVGELLDS